MDSLVPLDLLAAERQDPREAACPKRMVYGPCGGVRPDGTCEMSPFPCPFTDLTEPPPWSQPASIMPPSSEVLRLASQRPVILTDITLPPYDQRAIERICAILLGHCDAMLVGEHHNRPDYPPTLMTQLIRGSGGRAWVTLTCRDRNRLVLEQELVGLTLTGADAVLCVTGDGRAPGVRPGVTQVFDLDSTRLTALAASAGITAAVAEAPDAAPQALRPVRLWHKQRAGASVAVLNHVRTAAGVQRFVTAARGAGVTIPIVAGVAIYTDVRSAQILQNFPGLELDETTVAAVLDAADPVEAGIAAAVKEAQALMAIDGVVGINLSGLASTRGETEAARIKAEVGLRLQEAWQ